MIKAIGMAALLGLSISLPLAAHPSHHKTSQGQAKPREVLVVLAHPDDELFFAPAIAAEARQGSRVNLLFVTSGDAGPGVSDFEPGEELASARRKEAECSARALGAVGWAFLSGIGDGTLAKNARTTEEPTETILTLIAAEIGFDKPDFVVTWGPDGGYGHGDHRMVSAFVTQIVQAMPPETRPKLLFPALVHAPLPELLRSQGWVTTSPDLAAKRVAYTDADLAAASAAAQCHKTQFDEATRAALVPGFHAAVWKGEIAFRNAF